jgi:hypothetical protein
MTEKFNKPWRRNYEKMCFNHGVFGGEYRARFPDDSSGV